MGFTPISIDDYLDKHNEKNANPPLKRARLESLLEDFKEGKGCANCGAPIWVIGSALRGRTCFTCATGEAVPSEDYEIKQACDKKRSSKKYH